MQNAKVQLVSLSSMTPEDLYKSGLTDWSLAEIQSFYDDNYSYWGYPNDCFYRENFVVLNSLAEIEVE
ncbi:hypothetical protein [Acinetobacter baumannii]|uniref:hypothetical protein n=1 Tax=Acinetobacter baumannii TaxID=470 RepID=UPI0023423403|nr:hypothetical protein [Acinetobacter baumannii]MDC4426089.1 hypothetical protein [Acinetobacter baumannii]MDF7848508.1 hypothetical protein [Acinetobacter baumannii]MDF7854529.1 hypothetical protein [Acinetobacter baumannii]MDH7522562.1 hypothetical protein [Acinetobacter baumannii]MDH7582818.1 hypothetical protein [Acinetobacter baumannii]